MKHTMSYFAPGMVIAYGHAIDAKLHKHKLWQLCLPSAASILNNQPLMTSTIIRPNVLHQLTMPTGWVILAEPESLLGEVIDEMSGQHSLTLPTIQSDAKIDSLFEQLHEFPTLVAAIKHNPYQCQDVRLSILLSRLDACLEGSCLKPDQWRAKDVADWLALSESRFLHLIKAEFGIAWRPYLLWRRLICALQAIKSGQNATAAAYLAGFSDSAHLSRTLKSTFGMTSKQLLHSFGSTQPVYSIIE